MNADVQIKGNPKLCNKILQILLSDYTAERVEILDHAETQDGRIIVIVSEKEN